VFGFEQPLALDAPSGAALLRADPSLPSRSTWGTTGCSGGDVNADPALASQLQRLALCSARPRRGNLRFELAALAAMRFYLKALRALPGRGCPLCLSRNRLWLAARYSLLRRSFWRRSLRVRRVEVVWASIARALG